uniref:Uncharacterized protein n=1 Tax=Fagus sylvatica TaxID=28930 RepID=A0A2N9IZK1_FAGSY
MVYEWGWWFVEWSTPKLVGGREMFCVFHEPEASRVNDWASCNWRFKCFPGLRMKATQSEVDVNGRRFRWIGHGEDSQMDWVMGSKRRGLGGYGVVDAGVFFGLGGYGVGLVVRRGGYGVGLVVTAWWFSSRDPRLQIFFFLFSAAPPETTSHHQERPTDLFSDLDPPRPATTKERPTAWLSAQICNHRGHAVKHGPRWFLVVLSSDFRWFFVVQISTAAATIPTVWRRHHGGFWLFRFLVVFGSDLHGSS